MKLSDFVKLSTDEQAEAASKGVYLGERDIKPYVIFLFTIDNFFAEVFFDEVRNRITRVKPFKSIHALDPYLEAVDIEKLQ
ncbi:MAG: hypothetical protein H7Y07_13370 [Pyrinomonadaceae bacterium]|nr:hypothetical protein [Sphingobacteriaceae bacterium]